jgi:DNA (cytosine-5)-methyltransferase 1
MGLEDQHIFNQRASRFAPVPFDTTQITSAANYSSPKAGDPCHPLAAGAHAPAIAFGWQNSSSQGDSASEHVTPTLDKSKTPAIAFETCATLDARTNGGGFPGTDGAAGGHVIPSGMAVRRLTPVECERLQGAPDNYTRIPWRGKPAELCPDGPRYKACGNSMAIPVMRWLGERISAVAKIARREAA